MTNEQSIGCAPAEYYAAELPPTPALRKELRTFRHACLDCGDRVPCVGEFCEGCDGTEGFICSDCKGTYR